MTSDRKESERVFGKVLVTLGVRGILGARLRRCCSSPSFFRFLDCDFAVGAEAVRGDGDIFPDFFFFFCEGVCMQIENRDGGFIGIAGSL